MTNIKTQVETAKKPLTIEQLLTNSIKELGRALPEHMNAQRLTRIALTALRLNPKLTSDPRSFLAAVFQCAQTGLEPIDGMAWIIPYGNKASFQIGYKGYAQLFWRHMRSVSLRMEKVHENDYFDCDLARQENPIVHKPPRLGEERGKVVGYYALAFISGGGCIPKILTVQEALEHGKRFSKCWNKKDGKFLDGTPWATDFDSMGLKTVLIQLMKLLPKSIEIQQAAAMDGTVKSKIAVDMTEVPSEISFEVLKEETEEQTTPSTPSGDYQNTVPLFEQLSFELDDIARERNMLKLSLWWNGGAKQIKQLSNKQQQLLTKSFDVAMKLAKTIKQDIDIPDDH